MSLLETTRRNLLGLIGALAIFRPARAGGPAGFTLQPQLATGQRHAFEMVLKTERNGRVASHARSRLHLEVLGALDQGWCLRWTASHSELLDVDLQMRPLLELLLSMWDDVAIELHLDADGRLLGLANLPSLRERFAATADRLFETLRRDPAQAWLAPAVEAALRPMLANDAFMIQTLLKEPAILLGAMGRDFAVGEPLEVRTAIPSPLGSGEIPILGRFSVRGIEASRGRADLGWLMVLDRRAASAVLAHELEAPLQAMAQATRPDDPGNASVLAAQASQGLDFDEKAAFTLDTTTAWPLRVAFERRISNGGFARHDWVEFSVKVA